MKVTELTKVKYFLLYSLIVFIVTIIITYAINPDLLNSVNDISTKTNTSITQANGIQKVWEYVKNNGFKVPFQMLLLALLPIPFLYCINLTLTVILPGVLFGIMLRYDMKKAFALIISASPHFLIEVIGLCLFATLVYRLNLSLYANFYHKVFKNRAFETLNFKNELLITIKYYLIFVLPLILLAGIFETYIADIMLK